MKTYEVALSKEGLRELKNKLITIQRSIKTKKFKIFIAEKCLKELRKIQANSLTTVGDENDFLLGDYMDCNGYDILDDGIRIYNDAMIDISSKDMSEEYKATYPDLELSLAQIVEYGIGYTGQSTPHQEEVEDWAYDIRVKPDGSQGYGSKGWYYTDSSGIKHWTNGFQGRLVFYQLKERAKEKMADWIAEYWVEEALKDL